MKLKLICLLLFFTGISTANAVTPWNVKEDMSAISGIVLGQNYPNPTRGKTVIVVDFTSSEAVLTVYDVLGKLVEKRVIYSDQKRITLDVSDYKEGIYFYSIEAGGQKLTKRMTVSK